MSQDKLETTVRKLTDKLSDLLQTVQISLNLERKGAFSELPTRPTHELKITTSFYYSQRACARKGQSYRARQRIQERCQA